MYSKYGDVSRDGVVATSNPGPSPDADRATLASLAAANNARLIPVKTALAQLKGAIVFPMIQRSDVRVRDYLVRIDDVDLAPIDEAIAGAQAAAGWELDGLFAARIAMIAALLRTARQTIGAAIDDGFARHTGGDLGFFVAFATAKRKLDSIAL